MKFEYTEVFRCVWNVERNWRNRMAYKRVDFKLDETNDIDKRIEEAAKMFREGGA